MMKPDGAKDLRAMLTSMAPRLSERAWCFQSVSDTSFISDTAFAVIHEDEGACVVIPAQAASGDAPSFAKITLEVHSDLEAVGLTAAVSNALSTSGIACNVIAGLHHDHLFVPWDRRELALQLLEKLSYDASR